jgi:FkbM family methyltransferase
MAFVLHLLRPDHKFVDVGANVGSYTVLAAGAVGAEVICIEPVRSFTF